jgi:hypothetical protein
MGLADWAATLGPGLNVMGNTLTQIGLMKYAQSIDKAKKEKTPSETVTEDPDYGKNGEQLQTQMAKNRQQIELNSFGSIKPLELPEMLMQKPMLKFTPPKVR